MTSRRAALGWWGLATLGAGLLIGGWRLIVFAESGDCWLTGSCTATGMAFDLALVGILLLLIGAGLLVAGAIFAIEQIGKWLRLPRIQVP